MGAWPSDMAVDPMGEWPGELTEPRQRSNFASTMTQTLATLNRELAHLEATNVRLQVAIPVSQFRLDGYPRSTARAEHPGIILTMDTAVGALSYPCDTFTDWESNLRAIALALEALRMVARYGVAKRGQQYRGHLALDAPGAATGGFGSTLEAQQYIAGIVRAAGLTTIAGDTPMQLRQAKRITHPDMGGNADDFQRVTLAEQYLTEKGLI